MDFSVTFIAEYVSQGWHYTVRSGQRRWQLGRYICSCLHSNWSLATFQASNGKQRKWINCEVHGSLTNNRIPLTTPRQLPTRKLAPHTLPTWVFHRFRFLGRSYFRHFSFSGTVNKTTSIVSSLTEAIPTAGCMNRYTMEDNKRMAAWIANLRTDQTTGHTIFCWRLLDGDTSCTKTVSANKSN